MWCGQEGPGGWSPERPTGAGAVLGRAAGRLRRGSGRLEEEPPAVSGRGQGDRFHCEKSALVAAGRVLGSGGRDGGRRPPSLPAERSPPPQKGREVGSL